VNHFLENNLQVEADLAVGRDNFLIAELPITAGYS
jgi:hypothetical protein